MGKPVRAIRAAGWVTVGVIAAGGVATAATTSGDSGTKAASVTPAASAPAAKHAKGGKGGAFGMLKGRLLHGEATVLGKDKKPIVVAEQRGTVSAVSPTSISLTSSDGFKQSYVVTPKTRVRIDGKKSAIADVKPGQAVGILAKVDGGTQTAAAVIERPAKPATG